MLQLRQKLHRPLQKPILLVRLQQHREARLFAFTMPWYPVEEQLIWNGFTPPH